MDTKKVPIFLIYSPWKNSSVFPLKNGWNSGFFNIWQINFSEYYYSNGFYMFLYIMALKAGLNTIEKSKSDQLFDAYIDFQADATIKQKNFLNFQGYIKSKNLGFTQAQVGDVFEDLWNPDKKQEIIDGLEPKAAEVQEEAIQAITEKTEEHKIEMNEATNKANQEKTMKMEELTNLLQDKPENAEKNAEKIKDQVKGRLSQTIDRYVNKIKEIKNSSESEKKTKETELKIIKDELKKTKEEYENAKSFFLGKTNYKTEELGKISTRWIRFGKKTKEGWVVTRTLTERLQLSTMRRRMTENKLIEKFNKIWDKPTDGVRFVMGFVQARFLRYTGINLVTGIDKIGSNIGLQMNPEKFHKQFNTGKNNLFAVLDKGEKTQEEQKIIDALKKRINYYGYAYARQRASMRTDPFLQAEKNATEKGKIIQMTPPSDIAKAA